MCCNEKYEFDISSEELQMSQCGWNKVVKMVERNEDGPHPSPNIVT